MSVLSRTAILGIAPEPEPASYRPPAFTIVHSRPTTYRQVIAPLQDTALRGEGTWLEDAQQGPRHTEWVIPSDGYPDLAGWYLRAVIGPDTCTPGVSTTLAAGASAGDGSLILAAAPPAGSVLMIGTGDTLEYATTGTATGTGPYGVPLTSGLLFDHASGEAAVSQATHAFAQTMQAGRPSYSLTSDDGTGPLGWPGCTMSALRITVDPGGYVKFRASWRGFPAASVATFDYAPGQAQPAAGWGWDITSGSGASTRGQKLDLTLSRKTAPVNCINGQQSPYVISAGPMKADARYTAVYEDQADMDAYLEYLQDPVTHALTQPGPLGGCSLTLELPRAGWLAGEPDDSGDYLSASFRLSGIASPSPGPAVSATLVNYDQQAYS